MSEETRMMGLSGSLKVLMLYFSRFAAMQQCVRQTDGQTSDARWKRYVRPNYSCTFSELHWNAVVMWQRVANNIFQQLYGKAIILHKLHSTARLGRQRQVWLIPIADERVGVQVKLWNPLRTRAIPERFCGGDSQRRGALSSVCTFYTFRYNYRTPSAKWQNFVTTEPMFVFFSLLNSERICRGRRN